ncbi:Helix-turn-helix [Salinibacillus kushneri]|uniref:Helix-turn-helix n=1 Tax=Salinibacillus kushneri TaxID=237682 RepID=A0A1I0IH23_9BACI|nr:helix-turn-helix transcriptional regulator [Salinibacillus kushneri]SET95619.1 Helix-turn-helix [Salinibacillus kushneri]
MQTLNLFYIKNRRKELGITLQEMADELGFKNSSTYLKYETGAYSFKADQLPVLADALNCNISDFFNQNVSKIAINKKEVI